MTETEDNNSFEEWAKSAYSENRAIVEEWGQSPDPFTKAKAILIKRYAGVGKIAA